MYHFCARVKCGLDAHELAFADSRQVQFQRSASCHAGCRSGLNSGLRAHSGSCSDSAVTVRQQPAAGRTRISSSQEIAAHTGASRRTAGTDWLAATEAGAGSRSGSVETGAGVGAEQSSGRRSCRASRAAAGAKREARRPQAHCSLAAKQHAIPIHRLAPEMRLS